jgi:hypothetical protein
MMAMLTDHPTSPPSPTCRSPTSPTCISPDDIDDKLRHYVSLYGSRWSVIRCHMQAAFQCAFPARFLEHRWTLMQAQGIDRAPSSITTAIRSPLAVISADDLASTAQHGIQERLPLKGVSNGIMSGRHSPPASGLEAACISPRTSPNSKRIRDETAGAPTQPARPPPQSPRTPPKALLARHCPTFLLAPGSSLGAPDSVRRQLKAVYLAAMLQKPNPNDKRWLGCSAENDEPSVASAGELESATESEKEAIVALLARELAAFRKPARRLGAGGSPLHADRRAAGVVRSPSPVACKEEAHLYADRRAAGVAHSTNAKVGDDDVAMPPPPLAAPRATC